MKAIPAESFINAKSDQAKNVTMTVIVTFSYFVLSVQNYMLGDMTHLWQLLCAFLPFISLYDMFCILQRPYLLPAATLCSQQHKINTKQISTLMSTSTNWLLFLSILKTLYLLDVFLAPVSTGSFYTVVS